jgi:DNA-binding transcriptional LysR family regulator
VEAGIGVALIPLTHTQRGGRFDVRILPINEPRFVREVGLVRLKKREGDARTGACRSAGSSGAGTGLSGYLMLRA